MGDECSSKSRTHWWGLVLGWFCSLPHTFLMHYPSLLLADSVGESNHTKSGDRWKYVKAVRIIFYQSSFLHFQDLRKSSIYSNFKRSRNTINSIYYPKMRKSYILLGVCLCLPSKPNNIAIRMPRCDLLSLSPVEQVAWSRQAQGGSTHSVRKAPLGGGNWSFETGHQVP